MGRAKRDGKACVNDQLERDQKLIKLIEIRGKERE